MFDCTIFLMICKKVLEELVKKTYRQELRPCKPRRSWSFRVPFPGAVRRPPVRQGWTAGEAICNVNDKRTNVKKMLLLSYYHNTTYFHRHRPSMSLNFHRNICDTFIMRVQKKKKEKFQKDKCMQLRSLLSGAGGRFNFPKFVQTAM